MSVWTKKICKWVEKGNYMIVFAVWTVVANIFVIIWLVYLKSRGVRGMGNYFRF